MEYIYNIKFKDSTLEVLKVLSINYIKDLRKNYNFIIKDSKIQKNNKYYKEIIISKRISHYIKALNMIMTELNLHEECTDNTIKKDAFYKYCAQVKAEWSKVKDVT